MGLVLFEGSQLYLLFGFFAPKRYSVASGYSRSFEITQRNAYETINALRLQDLFLTSQV